MTDPLDPVDPPHPSGIKLIVMHGAMWPSRNMHIFGKDLTETEARVRVELGGLPEQKTGFCGQFARAG